MTKFGHIRETILRNNYNYGIMESTMSFQIQHTLQSNVRMYFYKFDFYDLVEVTYENEHIVVYDFPHSGDNAKVIEEDLERFAGYFSSAGLKGKRFLFDCSTKMPVSYSDFEPKRKIPKIPFDAEMEFAFILDKKNENYITTAKDVKVYVAHEISRTVDKLVLSLFNESINISKPQKSIEKKAAFFSFFLAGMLNGIRKDDIEVGIDGVDLNNKLYHSLSRVEFSSDNVEKKAKGLKVDKFMRISEKVVDSQMEFPPVIDIIKEFRDYVSLQEIVEQGLDYYIKKNIKDPGKSHSVIIDFDWQAVKSAYIRDGTLFITPTTMRPISYFAELVNSDNVQYILH
jgi:hypothetical protein